MGVTIVVTPHTQKGTKHEIYSWGLGCYLCCLAGIFVGFLISLLGFLGDLSSGLQKDFWVSKEVFLCAFL